MLLILGQGYSGNHVAAAARAAGIDVVGVRRAAADGVLAFDDPAVEAHVAEADYVLSSVPPDSLSGADPVLARFGLLLSVRTGWMGYLSSTGVYGDHGGAFVDEATPVGGGRRTARTAADLAWVALGAAVFRLPGIYGPGRSALDQVRDRRARRIDRPGHRFNRIHVADIARAVLGMMRVGATGAVNVVDHLPAEPRHVTEFACGLLGAPLPPLEPLDMATLGPMARGFWTESRCVAGGRLTRLTGDRLLFPDYKAGLTAILEGEAP